MRFFVTVAYREPEFEKRIGRHGPAYRWTFEIDAPDAQTALELADGRFHEVAVQSGVGWAREIIGWHVLAAE